VELARGFYHLGHPLSGQTTLEVQVIYLGVAVTISAFGVLFIANRIKSRKRHLWTGDLWYFSGFRNY